MSTDALKTYELIGLLREARECVEAVRVTTGTPERSRELNGLRNRIDEALARDDYDGAPYCSDCGARERRFCKCPPRPRND